jgi:hypothetical protein
MKKIVAIFSLFMSIVNNNDAQNLTTSIRIGPDYDETYLVVEDILGPSNIGKHISTWGYRAGLSFDAKLFKDFSLDSEIGYSLGGYKGRYNGIYREDIHQMYLSVTPQYSVSKFLKLKGGVMLNYNFKPSNAVGQFIEPYNYGLTGGITGNYGLFELGFRYTHYLNPYFSYRKLASFFDNGFEYWDTYSFFLGFKFWKK